MNWLSLLNPLNWIKVISMLKSIVDAIKGVVAWIQEWMAKRALAKKHADIEQAGTELKQANEVKDDTDRLKAKADALCRLEKLANPASDCDKPDLSK